MEFASLTDVGRRRKHNEDNLRVRPDLGLFVVADGMGGHEGGEIASAIACETIEQEVEAGATLSEAIRRAHDAIGRHPKGGRGLHGMGTTVVVVRLLDNSEFEAAWVGDSRIYQIKRRLGMETMIQVSRDHTPVQDLVECGAITPAQARVHPHRNIISQALGACSTPYPMVETTLGNLQPMEALLLCTDGLNGEIDDEAIQGILGDALVPVEQICASLVDEALAAGGSDNITVVVIRS